MASKQKLLKSKDVAHILDMSPDDVMILARDGKLVGIKEGRFWKFTWANVERYKRKQKQD